MMPRRTLPAVLIVTLVLGGCARLAESRFNPLNWFGPARAVAAAPGEVRPLVPAGQVRVVTDSRTLIGQVTDVRIDRTADGGILRATGLAPTQGYHNAQLVLVGVEDGGLIYEFRVAAPAGYEAVGAAATREVTVATMLSVAELAAIRNVRVLGATNALGVSR